MYLSNVTILSGVTISSGSLWLAAATVIVAVYYVRSAAREADLLQDLP
jgi:protein-S-isoprenylcysteine O-methyltransferase Ste14